MIVVGDGAAVAASGSQRSMSYTSSFGNWEKRCSVRNKPRREMEAADLQGHVLFPPEFVPIVDHAIVANRGQEIRDRLLGHSLYQYLHFTTILEHAAVLPVTVQISLNRTGLPMPGMMRRDAYKITTDEAWHAQFSYDFFQEIARTAGVSPAALVEPRFVRHIVELCESFECSAQALVGLFFAIVSETLVSGLLAAIPNDKRVARPVRALIADHAEDEGRHHAYFRDFLRFLWPTLSLPERQLLGTRVPEFVRVFLEPDVSSAVRMLQICGFTSREIDLVIAESYPPHGPAYDVRTAARGTVRAFRDVHALDDHAIYDAFAEANLMDTS